MIVTKTEACTKTKYKIYLDGTFAFVLYKGEMKRFGITEGADLPEETVETIRTDVILKRAKLRAMHLLEDMDHVMAQSSRYTLEEWKRRPWYRRLFASLLRLAAIWF